MKPTKDHETLVDVVGLLQGLPLAACLLRHLAAGQVNKVDLPVPRYVHALHNVSTFHHIPRDILFYKMVHFMAV